MSRLVAVVAAAALLAAGSAQGVGKTAPANTAAPTISGTVREGETLTAANGSWSGSTPITFTYRWQRCNSSGGNCDKISGATAQTYRLGHDDAGHTIRVAVTATNAEGSASAVSSATGPVASGAPANTSAPSIAGTAKDGETLTASSGSWTGAGPMSFEYQWRRCDVSGNNCDSTSTGQTRTLTFADVGHTIRVRVKAQNRYGSTKANSGPTGVVAPRGPLPANASPPIISGVARDGQVLTASPGSWSNGPTSFGYQWRRCDSVGNNCGTFAGGQAVRLGAADVGHTIRVTVAATNQYGTTSATSVPTSVVVSGLPSGAIKLPSGEISLPVEQVSLPQQLVVSAITFVPSRLTSRNPFVGRFRVSDTRGNVIRGALVYVIGLPYGWIRNTPEVVTGTDGWAQITLLPTALMPLHRAAVVFFVRARKPGESLLSGVAARRLVQVRIG
jgi:hypothetical protein